MSESVAKYSSRLVTTTFATPAAARSAAWKWWGTRARLVRNPSSSKPSNSSATRPWRSR